MDDIISTQCCTCASDPEQYPTVRTLALRLHRTPAERRGEHAVQESATRWLQLLELRCHVVLAEAALCGVHHVATPLAVLHGVRDRI